MTITYRISEIEDYEEFLNKLFNGLKYYQKKNERFRFKLKQIGDTIELTTIKLDASIN